MLVCSGGRGKEDDREREREGGGGEERERENGSFRCSGMVPNYRFKSLHPLIKTCAHNNNKRHPNRITLSDLCRSGQGHTVVNILTDVSGFWAYDNRESLLAGGCGGNGMGGEESGHEGTTAGGVEGAEGERGTTAAELLHI